MSATAVPTTPKTTEGILLVDKPKGPSSFQLVRQLRRLTHVRKIGHAGTLDPFATGVMVLLIGRNYTRLSDQFLGQDKEYLASLHLGATTDTYDSEGILTPISTSQPTSDQIATVLSSFQGTVQQIPPMFSAKKIAGKKLYELARQGKTIERPPITVQLETTLLTYTYPHLILRIACSKGTYIRSLANDIGHQLGCGAYLDDLRRLRSGRFSIDECVDGTLLDDPDFDVNAHCRYA
jgi:tRNA pseudouridine55 synthase